MIIYSATLTENRSRSINKKQEDIV